MSDEQAEQSTPPTPDELLAAAERYAKAGLKVYPVIIPGLKPDGKKDVRVPIRSWYDATDDLGQVRRWWGEQFPGAGIGVDMGGSRLAVADGDTHDGGVRRLVHFLEGCAEGPVSETASGGIHVWYRDPDGTVGTGSNILGDKDHPSGVDARGVGGTIFMPPTHVPGYGTYRWPDGEPDWSALPEAPAKLAAACPPGGRKKSTQPPESSRSHPVAPDSSSPFLTAGQAASLAGTGSMVHRDRVMTREAAMERLRPLWEAVRDTKPPNGLWQAVADFARAAAHYQCWWSQADVEGMVLSAYAAGGHGYDYLDSGDLRAIAGGFRLQREARDAGDLDDGWLAQPASDDAAAMVEQLEAGSDTSGDAVDALLAEMLTPEELKNRPPKKLLIEDLVHLDSEVWMIGEPGSRKSFVVLDMAGHVASGRPWQGKRVTQGTVVIIAAEGAGGIGSRIKAYEAEHGPMPASVRVLPRPVQAADVAGWSVLVKACERLAPVMVVGDTQARLTVGLEENSAKEMGIYVAAVGAIRRATGAAVFSIHHTGRSGGDARGSSALDGAQDTELKVISAKEPLRGELRIEKQKDLPEIEPIKLAFKIHTVGVDEHGKPITSLALQGADAWRETGQAGPEVEPWEAGHAAVIVQLFKVLREHGRKGGLTKAEARTAIVERFYGGDQKALNKSTYYTGWDRAQEKESAGGDPVMVRTGGQRWTVDEVALQGMEPREQ